MFNVLSSTKQKVDWLRASGLVLLSAGIFFFSQFSAAILVITGLAIAGVEGDRIPVVIGDSVGLQLTLIFIVAFISTYVIYKLLHAKKQTARAFLMLKNKPTSKQLLEVLATYGVYFVTLVVLTTIVGAFTTIDINQSQELGVASSDRVLDLAIIYIMLAVIPPIYEEILFRGFLVNALKQYIPYVANVAITSVLFGIAHLEYGNLNWIAAIDTMVFSVFLTHISQRHNSLYSAIILHAIKNSVAFIILFVA